jgi:hypothetical protein
MTRFVRAAGSVIVLLAAAPVASAADQKAIDAAIQRGADYLKAHYPKKNETVIEHYGIGPEALSGIALLAAKVPANDPALVAITRDVRDASYTEQKTYQLVLCLLFLDQLDDPADVPLIQMLGVRLVAGQTREGGWDYPCVPDVSREMDQWLRANIKANVGVIGKNDPAPRGKLHPNVEKYAAVLAQGPSASNGSGDNSNTQFGVLGAWVCRKHGVPVEAALDLTEKRFLATQDQTGGWSYNGSGSGGNAAMSCSGLLGLATGLARREEKAPKSAPAKEFSAKGPKSDPFFTPATPAENPAKKENKPRIPLSPAALRALAHLGNQFALKLRGVATEPSIGEGATERDLYLLWSLERVGVIYGIDKIGGVDWFATGADLLLKSQTMDGSWGPKTNFGPCVCTSFAILFLGKADLARDLSSKFRNSKDNELRAGASGSAPAGGSDPAPTTRPDGTNNTGKPLPSPVENESNKLANQLVQASAANWKKSLEKFRDAKGGDNTQILVMAIHRLEGDRKKETREALAERLTRMSAGTLKGMMKAEDAEMRRGAVLAAAMKDDKAHVPDLIDRLTDEEEVVVRAARAGLKSLTSQDFGPKNGTTKAECKAAAAAWRAWWAKHPSK